MRSERTRHPWLFDLVVGGIVGGVVGAVAAVNVVIVSGIERGYEASLGEVFQQSTVVGVVVVAIFLGGPVVGVLFARTVRHKRDSAKPI
jgi:hypothetical protein